MSKKTRERIYLENFLKAVGWSCAPSDIAEGESPDFVVTARNRAVGVELIQIFADQNHKRSKMREGESLRLRWLSDLATEYYDSGGPPARVQLQVQPSYFEKIRGDVPAERNRLSNRVLTISSMTDGTATHRKSSLAAPSCYTARRRWIPSP